MGTARITIKATSLPATDFILECDRIGQNLQENYTLLRFYMRAVSRDNNLNGSNRAGSQIISIDDPNGLGSLWRQEYSKSSNFLPAGFLSGYDRWVKGYWDVPIYHNADGHRGAITLRETVDYNIGASNQFDADRTASFNDFPPIPLYPGAPIPYSLDTITQSSVIYRFNGNGDGGAPILEWQIGYGTDPNSAQATVSSNGITQIGGLSRNTTYYFWSRGRNIKGWGPWSARAQANTLAYTPAPPTPLGIAENGQTSFHYVFRGEDDGGAQILEWQVGFSFDPNYVQATLGNQNGDVYVGGLAPGRTYYVWARGRNQQGWGDWSARSQVHLPAGSWLNVNGVWREAIPYVNVNGVWRLAQPYAKSVGLWKRAI